MTEYSGKITKVNERDWGSKTIYSWQIAGAPMWFRSETDPKVTEGKCYAFEGASPNKITAIKEVSEDSVKVAAEVQQQERKDAPPTSSPDYWRWKQQYDLDRASYFDWRDARADATRIVCAALDNDVLALGSAKGKKLDILIGQIKDTTEMLLRNEK